MDGHQSSRSTFSANNHCYLCGRGRWGRRVQFCCIEVDAHLWYLSSTENQKWYMNQKTTRKYLFLRSKCSKSMFLTFTYHFQYQIWEGKNSSIKTASFLKSIGKLNLYKEYKNSLYIRRSDWRTSIVVIKEWCIKVIGPLISWQWLNKVKQVLLIIYLEW